MKPGDLVEIRPGLGHGMAYTAVGMLVGPTAVGGVRSDIGCVDVLFSFGVIVVHPDNLRALEEPTQPAQGNGMMRTRRSQP